MLVGFAAKLWTEKIINAVVAANFNMFITNPCLIAEGGRRDLQLRLKSGLEVALYGVCRISDQLRFSNYLGIMVTR